MSVEVSTIPALTPTVQGGLVRQLPAAALGSFGVAAAVMASLAAWSHEPTWWAGFAAASVIAGLGTIASVIVLRRATGAMDQVVTLAMGASLVRMAVSLTGLLVAIHAFHAPAEPTGFMLCGYYAATLITETLLLSRAAGGRNTMTMKIKDCQKDTRCC
jgi:hypothetical protein